ncbi:hemerythrin domain-containing protein [Streptomyces sp. H34-S4]|uniref:hemerythrin domain-containing protein n=1 Tax=Streptomyces sp. H34-S4 TaxID=2996463 RepID=UPI00227056F7|nr:hemerythrin domain-containing protein [Streptomyces sp. H34-S4]MCY0937252.1 hemerythrin domain-containing protein [Streptomyces sp. H34-S4]
MDGIVLLRNDHKTVEKLFKRFEGVGEDAVQEKKEIVDRIIDELTTHALIEEEIFYPAAREAVPDSGERVIESVAEHHAVVWLCVELSTLDPSDERFDAKTTVLIENVRQHVEQEEQEWFPQVRRALGRNQLKELGERMEAAKAKASADPLELPGARS